MDKIEEIFKIMDKNVKVYYNRIEMLRKERDEEIEREDILKGEDECIL
ncbi:hypothetical protein KWH40_22900 [Escherichia coli]|nr:hypothetical protein [Escherichia coli]MCU6248717.1 hypothetical protein [Escherichia coli]